MMHAVAFYLGTLCLQKYLFRGVQSITQLNLCTNIGYSQGISCKENVTTMAYRSVIFYTFSKSYSSQIFSHFSQDCEAYNAEHQHTYKPINGALFKGEKIIILSIIFLSFSLSNLK